jgi:hypothetical protein
VTPSHRLSSTKVIAKVKEEHGKSSSAADEEIVKQLKLKDVAEGKAGPWWKERK